MAIQKLKLWTLFVVIYCSLGCLSNEAQTTTTPTIEQNNPSKNKPPMKSENKTTINYLDSINVAIEDTMLIYWAEVATNTQNLQEHEGNKRVMITKDGAYYFSRNKGALEDWTSYFNTPLDLYRTLSTEELEQLNKTLKTLQLAQYNDHVKQEGTAAMGGAVGYLYADDGTEQFVKKIETNVELYNQIQDMIRL